MEDLVDQSASLLEGAVGVGLEALGGGEVFILEEARPLGGVGVGVGVGVGFGRELAPDVWIVAACQIRPGQVRSAEIHIFDRSVL